MAAYSGRLFHMCSSVLITTNRAMNSTGLVLIRGRTIVRRWASNWSMSRIFRPTSVAPKDVESKTDVASKSQKLMMDLGVIKSEGSGLFALLPLGMRALDKLSRLLDVEMERIGCQKVMLPTLTPAGLWKRTGRYDTARPELFTVTDRHDREYLLSPTHEEAVTHLISSVSPLTHKQLPLRLYQVTSKFRDEARPRSGLLRGREFLMKDLYTFDQNEDQAMVTYNEVCDAYERFLVRLGVDFMKVIGSSGMMGGDTSHEFHLPSKVGEDTLLVCGQCGHAANMEAANAESCPQCGSSLTKQDGIEVAHTFILGTKYSAVLGAAVSSLEGQSAPLQMGCYGVGLSRLLAACVECLSTDSDIRWPVEVAPFTVCAIGPKRGSREAQGLAPGELEMVWDGIGQSTDLVVDDRDAMTVGRRLVDAKRTGFPFVVVAGRGIKEGVLEVHSVADGSRKDMSKAEVIGFFRDGRLTSNVAHEVA